MARRTPYRIAARDPAFAELWRRAQLDGHDVIRDRVRELAIDGVQEITEITDASGVVVERRVVRKDDVKAVQLAASRLPEFRDRDGGGVHVSVGVGIQASEDRSGPASRVIELLERTGALAAMARERELREHAGELLPESRALRALAAAQAEPPTAEDEQ
jgi:hypothetical protein